MSRLGNATVHEPRASSADKLPRERSILESGALAGEQHRRTPLATIRRAAKQTTRRGSSTPPPSTCARPLQAPRSRDRADEIAALVDAMPIGVNPGWTPELRRALSVLTRRTESSPRRDHDSQGPKRFCAHCCTLSKSALTAVKISREPHHQPQ